MASAPALASALLTLLVLTAGCSAGDHTPDNAAPTEASTAPSAPAIVPTERSGTLRVYPPVAQVGATPADADGADSALAAEFPSGTKGRSVTLQQRTEAGWKDVATAAQDGHGVAEFTAPSASGGRPATYRAVATGSGGGAQQVTGPASTDAWGAPKLDDQFGGSVLPDHWTLRGQEQAGNRLCSTSSPDALRVAGGALRLSALFDESKKGQPLCSTPEGDFDWREIGHVSTEGARSFRYGVAAARIKFQPLPGQHGAFWLQPSGATAATGDASRTGAEIDVIEWFGKRDNPLQEMTNFVRYYPDRVQENTTGREAETACGQVRRNERYGDDWAGKYHVFSVEWTPEHYVFRIDGKETCRTSQGVSGVEEFLILSLQANNYEIPLLDGDPAAPHSAAELPQHMYVDWVRYWQR